MNDDLFKAILSMDAYNWGYGSGMSGLPETGVRASGNCDEQH